MKQIKNTVLVLISSIISMGFAYLFHFFAVRTLPVADYGRLSFVMNLSYILAVPISALSLLCVQQFSSNIKKLNQNFSSLFKYSLKLGVVLGWISVLISGIYLGITGEMELLLPLLIFSLTFLPSSSLATIQSYFQSTDKFKIFSAINAISPVLRVLFLLWLVNQLGLSAAVLALFLTPLVISVLSLIYLRPELKSAKIIFRKELIPLSLVTLSLMILQSLDNFVVKFIQGNESAGIYFAALTVSRIIFFVAGSIISVLFPLNIKKNFDVSKSRDFWQVLTFGVVGLVAVTIGLSVFSPLILGIFFGPAFAPASTILIILCFAELALSFSMFKIYDLISRKLTENAISVVAAAILVDLILQYFFNIGWGSLGASIATFISFLALFLMLRSSLDFRFLLPSKIKLKSIPDLTAYIPVLFILITLFIFRGFLPSPGILGLRHDWMIPQFPEQLVSLLQTLFDTWTPQDLGRQLVYPSGYLFYFFLAIPALFGLTTSLISKLLPIAFISFSGYSMHKLCKSLKLDNTPSLIAGIFYMLTPVVFNKLVAGHLPYLLSYCLSPLILQLFIESISKKGISLKKTFACGLLVALAGVQIQFLVMLPTILFLYALMSKRFDLYANQLLIICAVIFLIHSFWLIPLLKSPQTPIQVFSSAATDAWIKAQSTQIANSLRLTGYITGYFDQAAQTCTLPAWDLLSYLIPLLAFSVLYFTRKHSAVYFTALAVVSIFIAKGISFPLGEVMSWLFQNFPPTVLFRELYHIQVITALSYSVLLAILTQHLSKIRFISIFLLVIILIYSFPFLSGNFCGQLQTWQPRTDDRPLLDWLNSISLDSRVLFLPMTQPVKYPNTAYAGNDPMIGYSSQPTLSKSWGTSGDSYRLISYLSGVLHDPNATYFTPLLSITNIEYMISRDDVQPSLYEFNQMARYDIFNNYQKEHSIINPKLAGSFPPVKNFSHTSIYLNPDVQSHIYGTSKATLAAADLSIFLDPAFVEKPAVFFVQQLSPEEFDFLLPRTGIFTQTNHIQDFILSKVPQKYKFSIGDLAQKNEDAEAGWTSIQKWWWYNYNYSSSIENSAISKAADRITIPFSTNETGLHEIWMKAYEGPDNGGLSLFLDSKTFAYVNTNSSNSRYRWYRLPIITIDSGDHEFSLLSDGTGDVVISQVVISPTKYVNLTFTSPVTKLKLSEPEIKYEKISPTEYLVHVKSEGPFFLVFSESYHPKWKAAYEGTEFPHFKVNFYANGYYIDQAREFSLVLSFN